MRIGPELRRGAVIFRLVTVVVLGWGLAGAAASFARTGIRVLPPGAVIPERAAVFENGGFVLAASDDSAGGLAVTASRHRPDGELDKAFARGGVFTTRFGHAYSGSLGGLVADQDGSLLLAATLQDDVSATRAGLVRLTASGALDSTFGNGGREELQIGLPSAANPPEWPASMAIADVASAGGEGSWIAGQSTDPQSDDLWHSAFLAKLNSNGTLETSFGDNGVFRFRKCTGASSVLPRTGGDAFIATDGCGLEHTTQLIHVAADGRTASVDFGTAGITIGSVLAGRPAGPFVMRVADNNGVGIYAFNATGDIDPAFNQGRALRLPRNDRSDKLIPTFMASDGTIRTAASANPILRGWLSPFDFVPWLEVRAVSPLGAPLPGFGRAGSLRWVDGSRHETLYNLDDGSRHESPVAAADKDGNIMVFSKGDLGPRPPGTHGSVIAGRVTAQGRLDDAFGDKSDRAPRVSFPRRLEYVHARSSMHMDLRCWNACQAKALVYIPLGTAKAHHLVSAATREDPARSAAAYGSLPRAGRTRSQIQFDAYLDRLVCQLKTPAKIVVRTVAANHVRYVRFRRTITIDHPTTHRCS